jgi:hypothetical protein
MSNETPVTLEKIDEAIAGLLSLLRPDELGHVLGLSGKDCNKIDDAIAVMRDHPLFRASAAKAGEVVTERERYALHYGAVLCEKAGGEGCAVDAPLLRNLAARFAPSTAPGEAKCGTCGKARDVTPNYCSDTFHCAPSPEQQGAEQIDYETAPCVRLCSRENLYAFLAKYWPNELEQLRTAPAPALGLSDDVINLAIRALQRDINFAMEMATYWYQKGLFSSVEKGNAANDHAKKCEAACASLRSMLERGGR